MKPLLIMLILLIHALPARADHITGGEMFYSLTSTEGGNYRYFVTLKLFMRCNSGRQFPDPAIISIFTRGTGSRIQDLSVAMSRQENIFLPNTDACITDPPTVCYDVAYYSVSVTLPPSPVGYVFASEVNYRISGISNLAGGQVGATYTCEIPPTDYAANQSAVFTGSDLVIVCADNFFSYSFAARDNDNDQLRYSFCQAYRSSTSGVNGVPAGNPPYSSVPYNAPVFTGSSPLGEQVSIDAESGLITGIAPAAGIYVVTVCVDEIRNGTVIATQRKDLQINIASCNIAAARLQPDYMLCRSSRTLVANNLAVSPLIETTNWTVKNSAGEIIHTSADAQLNYTFPVNGNYTITLAINRGLDCADSTTSPVFVYPGLVTAFDVTGLCRDNGSTFTDVSTTLTGIINSWKWEFGELTTTADISTLQNPSYVYPTTGIKNVRLVVTTTEGCRDTATRLIDVFDKPPLQLAFTDTLICINDQLMLVSGASGNLQWTPATNIQNANSATPVVSPSVTTTYFAALEIDGCRNLDSVRVRVVDHVTLEAMPDTTICLGDSVQLRVRSDGLQFLWSTGVSSSTQQSPYAIPAVTTAYEVTATIGGCSATAAIAITPIPYPQADAGSDTTICYASPATLRGTSDGETTSWSPGNLVISPTQLHTTAYPRLTTAFELIAYRPSSGCPKPARDTVLVTVLPEMHANAGNDTTAVVNQPLQLAATGGDSYTWSPPQSLSSVTIANPVAVFNEPVDFQVYQLIAYNVAGCADTAYMKIRVFATLPSVFVPTGFTPNGDGLNDLLVPVVAGMKQYREFSIFNRWGQLVFTTARVGHGWDGKVNGQQQPSGTFVWLVKAVDYMDKPYFIKGTVTLIR